MQFQVTLNLIAAILVVVGLALMGSKALKSGGEGSHFFSARTAWLVIMIGMVLNIIGVYAIHDAVFNVISYALILAAFVMASPLYAVDDSGSSHFTGFSHITKAWLGGFIALILLIIGACVPGVAAATLSYVAYSLFLLGTVLLIGRFFESTRPNMILSWYCLFAAFILYIIGV